MIANPEIRKPAQPQRHLTFKLIERREGSFQPQAAPLLLAGDSLSSQESAWVSTPLHELLRERYGLVRTESAGAELPQSSYILIGLMHDHPALRTLMSSMPAVAQMSMLEEGYAIEVTPPRVLIAANTLAGAYYGALKLVEMNIGEEGQIALPGGLIADWPAMRRRGMHLLVRGRQDLPDIEKIISVHMPQLRLNELILEINYFFDFQSHPEVTDGEPFTARDCRRLAELAATNGVKIIPMINCLGHQSWAENTFGLLKFHPEFDETPGPQEDKEFYCRSWCPNHPDVNALVCDLIDEMVEAFDATAFHAGMDEVFVLGECPRCKGARNADLFAKSVNDLHEHIVGKRGLEMLIWGDRLLDGKSTGYGIWEGSGNDTAAAIDLIPNDIVICDWHYEAAYNNEPATYPSVQMFQEKGFRVWPSGWNSETNARLMAHAALDSMSDKMAGYLATTWVGVSPVAAGLEGDQARLAEKNVAGVVDAIRAGARIAWSGH